MRGRGPAQWLRLHFHFIPSLTLVRHPPSPAPLACAQQHAYARMHACMLHRVVPSRGCMHAAPRACDGCSIAAQRRSPSLACAQQGHAPRACVRRSVCLVYPRASPVTASGFRAARRGLGKAVGQETRVQQRQHTTLGDPKRLLRQPDLR